MQAYHMSGVTATISSSVHRKTISLVKCGYCGYECNRRGKESNMIVYPKRTTRCRSCKRYLRVVQPVDR